MKPRWVTNNDIPWDQGYIGFRLKIHIEIIEHTANYVRRVWKPREHEVSEVLMWGSLRSDLGGHWHANVWMDKDGPELPHMPHTHGCYHLWQMEDGPRNLSDYNKFCVVLSRINSIISLADYSNPLFSLPKKWPVEVQKAVPFSEGELIHPGSIKLKPDFTHLMPAHDWWFIQHIAKKGDRDAAVSLDQE